ncbi:hypothetical protein [Fluviicola sp.]|jgi:hypothetical protein|uniref:hypothetical protein n=1 Tax=Fluviicola sp. TaxID=1917219 RepID=UPI002828DB84|nr:hypothetical protein [Fluviicola sp.]MDR0802748.1 hypothetical protein [Fluviicola sp.]
MGLIKSILTEANPNIVIFLMTSFIAFISWIVKGLIEKPINDSKNTFNKFLEKRIEILFEIKARLNFIAYFIQEQDECDKFKEQIQDLILKDGRTCYLNKEDFDNALKISITPNIDETLLRRTIQTIDEDLASQISKIEDEVIFFKKFSNYNPFKKFVGITLLALQYILSLILIVSILFALVYGLIISAWYVQIILILVITIGLILTNKWLNK